MFGSLTGPSSAGHGPVRLEGWFHLRMFPALPHPNRHLRWRPDQSRASPSCRQLWQTRRATPWWCSRPPALPGWSACCARCAQRWAAALATAPTHSQARRAAHWGGGRRGAGSLKCRCCLLNGHCSIYRCRQASLHTPSTHTHSDAGAELRRVGVPHSLSLAWRLGQAVARAQHYKQDAAAAVAAAGGGRVLFKGVLY